MLYYIYCISPLNAGLYHYIGIWAILLDLYSIAQPSFGVQYPLYRLEGMNQIHTHMLSNVNKCHLQ